jgi:hypothetical protein
MAVKDHGIKIKASYEKPKSPDAEGRMRIEVDYYASNDGHRLENMAKLARQFSFDGKPFDENSGHEVVWGEKLFKAKFELRNESDVKRTVALLNAISAYSIMLKPGSRLNATSLGIVVNKSNDFTQGTFPAKRRAILNDVLNVMLGTVVGTVGEHEQANCSTKNYRVRLVPTQPLTFVNPGDGKTYALDVDQPKFGLTDAVYANIPQKTLDDAQQEVLFGSRKFAFDYQGKSYAIDLTKPDLGLSAAEVKALSLDVKYLGELREELALAWDKAAVYLQDDTANRFDSVWTDFLFGAPRAYSKKSQMPELDLWKAISAEKKRQPDTKAIDKAFAAVQSKKYALYAVEKRLAEQGPFASNDDKIALTTSLQGYYTELAKLETLCAERVKKANKAETFQFDNVHGMMLELQLQTAIQKKAVADQMALQRIELPTLA